jgi:hypothetical protein
LEFIHDWGVSMIMLLAAGGFLEMASPEGNIKKYVSFIFALIFLDVLLSPVEAVLAKL